jgi:hypothetical protein
MTMTLDGLADSLPNGFHDAELHAVAIDYVKSEARLILDIWVADDVKNPDEIESYRLAEIILSDLVFWVSEAPDSRSPYGEAGPLTIDIGPMANLETKEPLQLPPLRSGAFANWIFVTDWNAFIYLAAQDSRLRWLADEVVRRG